MDLIFVIAPTFLTIVTGKVIQLTLVKNPAFWADINKISYWILFPGFLFYKTSTLELGTANLADYSLALIAGFSLAVLLAIVLGKITRLGNSSLTSVIQGAGRHNTFVGLAVATQLFGPLGESIGVIATAVLVPLSNFLIVFGMVSLLKKDSGANGLLAIGKEVIRNPIIGSIALGMTVNFLGWSRDPVFYELTGIFGAAALPVILMCIGASLRFEGLSATMVPCAISILTKMIVFPLTTFAICRYFALPQEMTVIAVIFAACPTSPAGFLLAKQLGGDAPLMATIISLQTTLAVITIPLWVYLVNSM